MDNKPDIHQLMKQLPQLGGLEFLGEGGFKVVYKAQIQNRWEAVKVVFIPPVNEENGLREEIVARIKREIGALKQCQTDCLVSLGALDLQTLKIGEHDYLVYSEELLPGESLRQPIRLRLKPSFHELRLLTQSLMQSLKAIEASGHIHRDIKPDNIMVTGLPERPYVILDLGIAFKVHGTELTARNAGPPGTMVYMAPELFQPQYKDVLDIRSDIYSSGVTVYEYAVGEHPFVRRGDNQYTTLYRIVNQAPEKLSNRRNDLPPAFCRLVDRCFRKLPALRICKSRCGLARTGGYSMKLLAQHGHQPSDKIARGVSDRTIQGAIFSARCLEPDKAPAKIADLRAVSSGANILLDPEYYATRQIGSPNNQLGNLGDWSYFTAQRRRDLVRGEGVRAALRAVGDSVKGLDVSAHIAPNIYISQSFDSLEAGIALNFVAEAKAMFGTLDKPVYATLAIDRRALLSLVDFKSFLNDLTSLETPPDGFYVLVGLGPIDERNDLAHSEVVDANVIGGWMLVNYVLSQNGFKVINGCADLLAPFLGAVGGTAGATGWWSNLRLFTMGRYIKPDGQGGKTPSVRYVSKRLLNRVKANDLTTYSSILPDVLNGLDHDPDYTEAIPDRTAEALQTWEAISSLNADLTGGELEGNLAKLAGQVENAKSAYATLQSRGISEGIEAVTEYLQQLSGAIEVFKKLAELA